MADDRRKLVAQHLQTDKSIALSVLQAAAEELQRGYVDPVPMDITGAPTELASFKHFKQQQQAALLEIRNDLFHRKVEVTVLGPNGDQEERTYLLTKGRFPAGLGEDHWYLVPWTMPVTQLIRDADIGTTVERERPRTGAIERMTIRARGIFDGNLLPKLTEVTYDLGTGLEFVADETVYLEGGAVEVAASIAKPEAKYEAATEFGLHEIIEQADPTQWQALHLPFHDTVLVEGPPGSGKTSVGLMRVPCLIDRQWEELGIDPSTSRPFHEESTMRVLVMNEEMIEYLGKLIRSVGAQGLPVQTMADFCRRLCRLGGTLTGRTVRESHLLTTLKHHPLAFPALWAGFVKSVDRFWREEAKPLLDLIRSLDRVTGPTLIDRLAAWKNRVIGVRPDNIASSPNLADVLRRWQVEMERLIPDPAIDPKGAEAQRRILAEVREQASKFCKATFDRPRLYTSMLESEEFLSLLTAAGVGKAHDVVQEWEEQTKNEVQHISEGDLLLHARLATHLTLLRSSDGGLPYGGVTQRLTHVVIDEAQDIAVDHVNLIRALLDPQGTLTLVGDLRQRVTHSGFFRSWADLDLGTCTRAVFAVNHRQSQPLGKFVADLHRCLFEAPPEWRPSERRNAPKPRIRPKRGFAGLARVVAEEVRHWRETIPGATVGIIYHGKRWNRALQFAERIEESLGDTLTEVRVASSRDSGQLNRIDCAIIASVEVTKGLEFDAVVFIDRHLEWTARIASVAEVRRNGLYVAASRAKRGLSLLLDDRCELSSTLDPILFELVPIVSGSDEDDADAEDLEVKQDDLED